MEFEEKDGLKIWWLYLITGIGIFPTVVILMFYKRGLIQAINRDGGER